MKKGVVILFSAALLLSIVSVLATNLDIQKETVSNVIISELNEPAVFNFQIKNLGSTDNFEIYSLVGVDFSPRGNFEILGGQTKSLEVRAYPEESLRANPGILNFAYNIRGQNSGIKSDMLTVEIIHFGDAVRLEASDISPESSQIRVYVENRVNHDFPEITLNLDSAFFKDTEKFSLAPLEKKEFNISLDKNMMKGIVAGSYILTGNFVVGDFKESLEGTIKFLEKSQISTKDSSSGMIFRKRTVEKTNDGNIPAVAEVNINEDIISRLFTRFSSEPSNVIRNGAVVRYFWNKELQPSESLVVKADTNYLYPLLMLIFIVVVAYLAYLYKSSALIVKKRVNFVRTKGGEFALKVTLDVSARKFVEKISIVDRLPGIVKIYERFGTYRPDKIDAARGRLEWNIESLQPGESRVFSYIIYSKMAVVGRFELPAAIAIFEKDGKTKETSSNKAFFMNETRTREEEF